MRYTLLLYYHQHTTEELGPEALAEGMRAFQEYTKALDDGEYSPAPRCSNSRMRPPL
ncbi:MAG: hypothetical protein ACRDYE_12380 [Acidimicrobiales bacterium]